MVKIILMIIAISCSKSINELKNTNKGINDDLIKYCKEENKGKVLELLKNKADVNFKDQNGNTALIYAIERNWEEGIQILLDAGAEVNIKNNSDIGPLLHCFFYSKSINRSNLMKKLIECGADVNIKHLNNEYSALINAICSNEIEIVKLLLDAGANVNDKVANCSPLMKAVKYGYLKIIDVLIKAGAEYSDEEKEKIDKLIEERNDINFVNRYEQTSLFLAISSKDVKLAKLLIEKGADINKENRWGTPLIAALKNHYIELVSLMIEKGANVDGRDIDTGNTALVLSLQNNHIEIAKLLIEKGADINDKDTYTGDTGLILALKGNHIEIAELLIEKGANINYKNPRTNQTIFSLTLEKKNLEMLGLLIEKGVNITSLHMDAIAKMMEKDTNLFRNPIDRGIEIYSKDEYSKSLLTYFSDRMKIYKEKIKKDLCIKLAYLIVRKMAEDYIQLFISMNKNSEISQEAKDEINNHINMLYSLQKLPPELFLEIINKF